MNKDDIQTKQNQIDSYKRDLDNSYKILDDALALNSKL
jgi:Holliday junction resolvase RusA-like endonuclease